MLQIAVEQLFQWAVQHQRHGRLPEAEALYRQVIARQPEHDLAQFSLGILHKLRRQYREAIDFFALAIRQNPARAEYYCSLGDSLHALGEIDSAITQYRLALERKPQFPEVLDLLALALKDVGQLDEALDCHRRCIALQPQNSTFHGNLLFSLQYHPQTTAQTLLDESRRWGQAHGSAATSSTLPHTNDRSPDRPLRVGYVSADFHSQTCVMFIVPLFRRHDPRQVEIFCYAEGDYDDQITHGLRQMARGGGEGGWRTTTGLSDMQAAEMIRNDRIDILVDLKLHTNQNRLLVFPHKPAPIQVTWLGYPGTTGLSAIDYRLTDPYLDPPGRHDDRYVEQSIRLPDTFWCYDPLVGAPPPISPPPCETQGQITFGSLNHACKINPPVLSLWARLLNAVPDARLLLLVSPDSMRRRILDQLSRDGIAAERVQFATRTPRESYLQLYHHIDIAIDTFPYNGHTTSLDALWMGVPVVTLVGQTVVGRAGYSQLSNLGLPELVARTPEQYVRIAAELAADRPRLRAFRSTLRQRMQQSPLMDDSRFARHVEEAYRALWKRWCASS